MEVRSATAEEFDEPAPPPQVDEPDAVARRLYESLGFTNRSGGPDGPLMYFYERHL